MTNLMNSIGRGVEAYGAYFIFIELCVAKVDKDKVKSMTEDDCRFRFPERVLREKLRMRATRLAEFFQFCATEQLLEWHKSDTEVANEWHFYVPKLLEFLKRKKRKGPEEEEETEEDKDQEPEGEEASAGGGSDLNSMAADAAFGPLELAQLWNARMGRVKTVQGKPMPLVDLARLAPSEERWATCLSRIKTEPNPEVWRDVIDRMARSEFCRGRSAKRPDWAANFDFLLKTKTLVKVLEGEYGCTAPKLVHSTNPEPDPVSSPPPPATPEQNANAIAFFKNRGLKVPSALASAAEPKETA